MQPKKNSNQYLKEVKIQSFSEEKKIKNKIQIFMSKLRYMKDRKGL